MKITNFILAGLFVLFALVQINDVDPWLWVAFYLVVAVFCFFGALRRYYHIPLLIALFGTGFWLGMLLPDFISWIREGMPTIVGSMKAESPYIELVREFLGLLIALAALAFQYYQLRRAKSQ